MSFAEYARVKLAQPRNGSTDYINASYVQYAPCIDEMSIDRTPHVTDASLRVMKQPSVSKGDNYRRYISTQGPLPDTFPDFWQMVWEQESRVLVMLTKQEEMNKVR